MWRPRQLKSCHDVYSHFKVQPLQKVGPKSGQTQVGEMDSGSIFASNNKHRISLCPSHVQLHMLQSIHPFTLSVMNQRKLFFDSPPPGPDTEKSLQHAVSQSNVFEYVRLKCDLIAKGKSALRRNPRRKRGQPKRTRTTVCSQSKVQCCRMVVYFPVMSVRNGAWSRECKFMNVSW